MIDPTKFWEERVKKYGKLSASYLENFFYSYDDDLRWSLFRRNVVLQRKMKVLDVGCNYGKWCVKMHDLGGDVTGIDISKKAIQIANKYKEDRAITYQAKKIEDTSFKKGNFDIITTVTVLQHILDRNKLSKAIKKITYYTKKGGTIFIIESAPFHEKKSKLDYKAEWQFKVFVEEFEKNNCELKKVLGFDYLGYKGYWLIHLFLRETFLARLLQRIYLFFVKPLDKLFIHWKWMARFSNTKMMIFKKK